MIAIDGAMGEGGGQILRSALCLSLITGAPFRLTHIRAARPKPGLRAQHLAALQAAARISHAEVVGGEFGASQLSFSPGPLQSGNYHFAIPTAGASALVLQTILLPLALLPQPSHVTICGGTHVPWSPCFHYLDWQWRPLLLRMGIDFSLQMNRSGFYPEGGGEITAAIAGASQPRPLQLTERGELRRIRGLSGIGNLPLSIAERQREQAERRLRRELAGVEVAITLEPFRSLSRGTVLLLLAEFERSQACFFALGARGKPAERVADEAVDALLAFLQREGAVEPWLADQLLLPLALAQEPSCLHTSEVTPHLLTNAAVIRRFLPVEIEVAGEVGAPALVTLRPAP